MWHRCPYSSSRMYSSISSSQPGWVDKSKTKHWDIGRLKFLGALTAWSGSTSAQVCMYGILHLPLFTLLKQQEQSSDDIHVSYFVKISLRSPYHMLDITSSTSTEVHFPRYIEPSPSFPSFQPHIHIFPTRLHHIPSQHPTTALLYSPLPSSTHLLSTISGTIAQPLAEGRPSWAASMNNTSPVE